MILFKKKVRYAFGDFNDVDVLIVPQLEIDNYKPDNLDLR